MCKASEGLEQVASSACKSLPGLRNERTEEMMCKSTSTSNCFQFVLFASWVAGEGQESGFA